MQDQLQAIWAGYLSFGFSEPLKLLLLIIDVLGLTALLWILLRRFNTRRGWSYMGGLAGAVVLLTATALVTLPGLHFLAQCLLVILLVGWPLYFHDTWVGLFSRRSATNQTLPGVEQYLSAFALTVISLLLAGLITVFGHGVATKTAEFPEPITITAVNLPTGVSANLGDQTSVKLIITAPRSQWASLKSDSFSATVDVGQQSEGTYDLPVSVTVKANQVKILRLSPTHVTVTVEPIIAKTVPVVAKFTGSAGDQLVPDDPVFDPDKVQVSGPKSVVTDLTQAIVQIKLNGETKPIDQPFTPVGLTVDNETIGNLTFTPAQVGVKVAFVKAGKLKTVGIRPVLSGQPASGYWVKQATPTPATVVVTGTADALDKLTDLPTDPVSVAGLSAGTTLPASVSLPAGLSFAQPVDKFTLKIDIDVTQTTKTITPEIDYANLSPSLKVSKIDPTSVSLVVSGDSATLAGLSGSSVKLALDLSAYKSAGTYSVTVTSSQFTLPTNVSLVSFLPSALTVTLDPK